jgi:hypothetical protein
MSSEYMKTFFLLICLRVRANQCEPCMCMGIVIIGMSKVGLEFIFRDRVAA